jgi:hypothetical protein
VVSRFVFAGERNYHSSLMHSRLLGLCLTPTFDLYVPIFFIVLGMGRSGLLDDDSRHVAYSFPSSSSMTDSNSRPAEHLSQVN